MRTLFFLVAFVSLIAAGCKPEAEVKETVLTGKVTLDGKDLSMGEVVVEGEGGKSGGRGEIMADGTYRVPSAPLGKIKVAVRTSNHAQYAGAKTKGGKAITKGGRDGQYVPVPSKYEDVNTSGLSFTVEKDKPIDLKLSSN